jgi:transitional endoplasmic reticulum ATPase
VSTSPPPVEEFDRRGWRVRVVDPAGIAAAAAHGPVELLHGPVFGPPVDRARLWVSAVDRAGEPVLRLTAAVHSGGSRARFALLGHDPIGVLLARRAAAGDPRARRVVAGLEYAAGQVSRRLGLPPPAATAVADDGPPGEALWTRTVVDDGTGLAVTVAGHEAPDGGRATTVRATVAAGGLTAAHLAALFDVLAGAVADSYGGRGVGDRTVELRRAAGSRTGPDRVTLDRVTLDQVGGLPVVVAQFREVATSFRHPRAMARWGARRPQGILLYGPPGTGKTMLAHALATEIGGTLREIRTPEILDKWLGASERNMKRIFREARRYRTPTVLLFDEFDSIIGYAGAGDDSGSHAVNAVAGIFKQEMNGLVEANPHVIVVATTNFPHRIDESLVRSGRFDLRIAIDLPDARGRAQILAAQMRTLAASHEVAGFRMFADDIDVDELGALSAGLSGADLREVLRRAQLDKAMQEARSGVAAAPIAQADLVALVRGLRALFGNPPDTTAPA